MRPFFIAFVVVLCGKTAGIPVAKAMGCGRSENLSLEKRAFCCEYFNLNCSPKPAAVSDQIPWSKHDPRAEANTLRQKSLRIRSLGEDCKLPIDRCATGLQCKRGYCLRERSKRHLDALLRRGKLVEEEERGGSDRGTDEEMGDPLPAQKGLIIEGQSVNVESIASEESNLISSSGRGSVTSDQKRTNPSHLQESSRHQPAHPRKNVSPTKTPTPLVPYPASYQDVAVEGQAVKHMDSSEGNDRNTQSCTKSRYLEQSNFAKGASESKNGHPKCNSEDSDCYSKPPQMEEEDELAANIADLLATKLGVSLDSEEMHAIRELIAGTLDERLEREDQVVENRNDSTGEATDATDATETTSRPTDDNSQLIESNSNRTRAVQYEPLVQCNAEPESRDTKSTVSKNIRSHSEKPERFVHVTL